MHNLNHQILAKSQNPREKALNIRKSAGCKKISSTMLPAFLTALGIEAEMSRYSF